MPNHIDPPQVIIIGSGPAGISAAVQLIRAGISVMVIAKKMDETYLNANLIENIITFPEGISGQEFHKVLQQCIRKFNIPIFNEEVILLQQDDAGFYLRTKQLTFQAPYVVVATGTKPKLLSIPGEDLAFSESRLFYNIPPTNPVEKAIVVMGSGDAAYDYALNLHQNGNKITMIQRTDRSYALSLLQTRVSRLSNIEILRSCKVSHITFQDQKLSVHCQVEQSSSELPIPCDLIFVAIGREPNTSFLEKSLQKRFNANQSIENLYYGGDVANGKYRQIALAMGDGVRIGMEISEKISRREK
ncbi:MAG: NAD(P)/FAD-dependent oxidoreductase [Promethearchaeota archaeon]|nr:MAG: NAD(P)/FAD-dependent oxidoreductase [Candidatus Lokiarchaeota archaeon]